MKNEEFKTHFKELYQSANDDDKDEMIRLFENGVEKHISKIDSFIEKTTLKLKFDEMFETCQ